MAEYNFWDDRTWDTCDENWCPVANDYCLKDKNSLPSCDYCKEMQEYMYYINKEEKRKQWTYKDVAYYITHHCESDCYCKWAGCWDCVKDTLYPSYHPQCSAMIMLAYNMILDHLY